MRPFGPGGRVAPVHGANTSGISSLRSVRHQPDSIPGVGPETQLALPMLELGPTLRVLPGPVARCPLIFALLALMALGALQSVAMSPLSPGVCNKYGPRAEL